MTNNFPLSRAETNPKNSGWGYSPGAVRRAYEIWGVKKKRRRGGSVDKSGISIILPSKEYRCLYWLDKGRTSHELLYILRVTKSRIVVNVFQVEGPRK